MTKEVTAPAAIPAFSLNVYASFTDSALENFNKRWRLPFLRGTFCLAFRHRTPLHYCVGRTG